MNHNLELQRPHFRGPGASSLMVFALVFSQHEESFASLGDFNLVPGTETTVSLTARP